MMHTALFSRHSRQAAALRKAVAWPRTQDGPKRAVLPPRAVAVVSRRSAARHGQAPLDRGTLEPPGSWPLPSPNFCERSCVMADVASRASAITQDLT
jgi:hypothetical protein